MRQAGCCGMCSIAQHGKSRSERLALTRLNRPRPSLQARNIAIARCMARRPAPSNGQRIAATVPVPGATSAAGRLRRRRKGNLHEAFGLISSTTWRADSRGRRFAGLRTASCLGERIGDRHSQVHGDSGLYRYFPGGPSSRIGGRMSNHGSHIDSSQESGDPGPYWRRMHHDWRFWVGAVLMFAALAVYVLSGDLAFVPRHMPHAARQDAGQ